MIAFQIENEYGSYGTDLKYLRHLKQVCVFLPFSLKRKLSVLD